MISMPNMRRVARSGFEGSVARPPIHEFVKPTRLSDHCRAAVDGLGDPRSRRRMPPCRHPRIDGERADDVGVGSPRPCACEPAVVLRTPGMLPTPA
jgi:hypothetical protein